MERQREAETECKSEVYKRCNKAGVVWNPWPRAVHGER